MSYSAKYRLLKELPIWLTNFLLGKINRKIQIKWNLNLTNYGEMGINSFKLD